MTTAATLLGFLACYLLAVGTYLAIVSGASDAPRRAAPLLKAALWLSLLTLVAVAWGEWFTWLQTLYLPIVPQ